MSSHPTKMDLSTRLSLCFFVVLCTHSMLSATQATANTPWSSPRSAEQFISSFLSAAGVSGAFSADQMDDMSFIGDTLMGAMDKMALSNKSSKSRLQALNMAFASSVAEIAVAEQGGSSLEVKTNAIADAFSTAFLQTTGAVNVQFVNEIKNLVTMFAQNNVSFEESSGAAAATSGGYGSGPSYGPSGSSSYQFSLSSSSVGSQGLYGQDYQPQETGGTGLQDVFPVIQYVPDTQGPSSSLSALQSAPVNDVYGPGSYQSETQGPDGPEPQGPYTPNSPEFYESQRSGGVSLSISLASASGPGEYGPYYQGPFEPNYQGPFGQDFQRTENQGPNGPKTLGGTSASVSVASASGPGQYGPNYQRLFGQDFQGTTGAQGPNGPQALEGASVSVASSSGPGQYEPNYQGTTGTSNGPQTLGGASVSVATSSVPGQNGPNYQGPFGQDLQGATETQEPYGPQGSRESASMSTTSVNGPVLYDQSSEKTYGTEDSMGSSGTYQDQTLQNYQGANLPNPQGSSSFSTAFSTTYGSLNQYGGYNYQGDDARYGTDGQGSGASAIVAAGGSSGLEDQYGYGNGQGSGASVAVAAGGSGLGDQYGYGTGQGSGASATVAAGGSSGLGDQYGYGNGQGSVASVAVAAGGPSGLEDQYGYDNGQRSGASVAVEAEGSGLGDQYGYDNGQGSGASVAVAAEGSGLGDQYRYGAGQGTGASSTSGGLGGLGGQYGYSSTQGFGASVISVGLGGLGGQGYSSGQSGYGSQQSSVSVNSATSAASRLSSPEANARVSSAASSLASGGVSDSELLSSVIGNAVSQISTSSPELSGYEILVQALMEVLSSLVHLLTYADVGYVDYSAAGQSTQLVGQSVVQAMY